MIGYTQNVNDNQQAGGVCVTIHNYLYDIVDNFYLSGEIGLGLGVKGSINGVGGELLYRLTAAQIEWKGDNIALYELDKNASASINLFNIDGLGLGVSAGEKRVSWPFNLSNWEVTTPEDHQWEEDFGGGCHLA